MYQPFPNYPVRVELGPLSNAGLVKSHQGIERKQWFLVIIAEGETLPEFENV